MTNDSWVPIAIRRDGPDFKQGYGHIPARTLAEIQGICAHSMEGSLAAAMGELDRLDRQASWTFSNPKSGKLLQHYPLQSVTWGNGSPEANRLFVSVEHEGVAGEDLTDSQVSNLLELIPRLMTPPFVRHQNLWEHTEMVAYGAQPTACPSGRIPWQRIITALDLGDEDMTPEQEAELKQLRTDVDTVSTQKDALDVRIKSLEDSRKVLSDQVLAALKTGNAEFQAVADDLARRLKE